MIEDISFKKAVSYSNSKLENKLTSKLNTIERKVIDNNNLIDTIKVVFDSNAIKEDLDSIIRDDRNISDEDLSIFHASVINNIINTYIQKYEALNPDSKNTEKDARDIVSNLSHILEDKESDIYNTDTINFVRNTLKSKSNYMSNFYFDNNNLELKEIQK